MAKQGTVLLTALVFVVGFPETKALAEPTSGIVLVFDTTGNLNATKLTNQIDAIKAYLANEDQFAQDGSLAIGIVLYGRTGAANVDLIDVDAASLANTLFPALDAIVPQFPVTGPPRDRFDALDAARSMLSARAWAPGEQLIIHVGQEWTHPQPRFIAEVTDAATTEQPIMTLGFTESTSVIQQNQLCRQTLASVSVEEQSEVQGCGTGPGPGPSCSCPDDGLFCTFDYCISGACSHPARSCSDSNVCTTDGCDEANNVCTHTSTFLDCDDGDACTDASTCNAQGICEATSTITCDDTSPCTDDSCDPATGCVYTPNTPACGAGTELSQTLIVLTMDVSENVSQAQLTAEIDDLKVALSDANVVPQDGTLALAILVYGSTVEPLLGFTPVTPTNLTNILNPALDNVVTAYQGGALVNLGDAINYGRCMHADDCAPGSDRFVFLLGHGASNTGPSYEVESQSAGDEGIEIYASAVMASPTTQDQLAACAALSHGGVVHARTPNEFSKTVFDTFRRMGGQLEGQGGFCEEDMPCPEPPLLRTFGGPLTATSLFEDEDLVAWDLVQALIGAEDPNDPTLPLVDRVMYHGHLEAAGLFVGGSEAILLDSGIILGTGKVVDVKPGPEGEEVNNSFHSWTTMHGLIDDPPDPDLTSLSPGDALRDTAILEFYFTCPGSDVISFQYVFSSEEYNEYVNSRFNDVFGFFVDGVNIALLPDRVTPVLINTVNCGQPYDCNYNNTCVCYQVGCEPTDEDCGDCQSFVNNECCSLTMQCCGCNGIRATEMDGLTVVLDATISGLSDTEHHMKLAIADVGDEKLDSNVFIKAGSFRCTTPHAPHIDLNVTSPVLECGTATLDAIGSESDPAGLALQFDWDLDGDGLYGDVTGPVIEYAWLDHGSYPVSVLVTDSDGNDGTANATIEVLDQEPSLSISGPTTVAVNQTASFTGAAHSPCDDLGQVEWDFDYVNGVFDELPIVTGSQQEHAWSIPGDYTVAIRVADEDSGVPVVSTLLVTVVAEVSDLHPVTQYIEWTATNNGFNPGTSIVFADFRLKNVGTDTIRGPVVLAFADLSPDGTFVVGSDGITGDEAALPYVDFTDLLLDGFLDPGEETVLRTVTWDVAVGPGDFGYTPVPYALDLPPNFTSDPITVATEGVMYTYAATADDPDGDPLYFEVQVGPDEDSDGVVDLTIDAASGLVSWRPSQQAAANAPPGGYPVVLRVLDGYVGGVDTQSFNIEVLAVNVSPIITSIPVMTWSLDQPGDYQYDVNADDPDPEDLQLTFSLVFGPSGMSMNGLTGELTWALPTIGDYFVRVAVQDSANPPVIQEYTLSVFSCLDPPTISPFPLPPPPAIEGVQFSFQVQASSSDPAALLSYDLESPPVGMTISDTGLVSWLPSYTSHGTRFALVVVSSAPGCLAEALLTVDVEDRNGVPEFITSPASVEATEGVLYLYDALAVDPDDEIVMYSLDAPPAGMTIDPLLGFLRWRPSQTAAPGPYPITIRASDPLGASATQDFSLNVILVDVPPFIRSTPPTLVLEGELYEYAVDVVEHDDDPISFSLTSAGHPASHPDMTISPTGVVQLLVSQTDAQSSPYFVEITVTDSPGGNSDTQAYWLYVQPVNIPPVITVNCPTTANEGAIYSCTDVSATDEDEDNLIFFLDPFDQPPPPLGLLIHPVTGELFWQLSHTAANQSPYTVTVKVSDGFTATAGPSFLITVQSVNQNPVIYSAPVIEVEVGAPYDYAVLAYDLDGDTLFYSLTASPGTLQIDPDDGQITGSVPVIGTYTVSVVVTDGNGGSATQTYPLYVQPPSDNGIPSFTSTPTFTATVGTPYTYSVSATDPDGNTLTFSPEQLPANAELVNNGGNTATLTWTPTEAQVGTHELLIRVDDGLGAWSKQLWPVSVSLFGDNAPPRITSTAVIRAQIDATYQYDVQATDDDDPDESLRFALRNSPAGMTIEPEGGSIIWTPSAENIGTYDVSVRVSDPRGAWGDQHYRLTVSTDGTNGAPQIHSSPVMTAQLDVPYLYPVLAFDPDSDVLTYILTAGPAGMGIDEGSGIVSWTPTALQLGTHDVEILVDDQRGGTATQAYALIASVDPNNMPPVIVSMPIITAKVGETYSYPVVAIDDPAQPLTHSLTLAPENMGIDSSLGTITWVPTETQIGSHDVEVLVDDELGGTASQAFQVVVSLFGNNHAPQIISVPVPTAGVGSLYLYTVSVYEPDGDAVIFSLDEGPAGASIDPDVGDLTWTPTAAQEGAHAITARVTDDEDAWAIQVFTVTVSVGGNNHAPTITSTPPETAQANADYSYQVRAEDQDSLDVLSYAFTIAPSTMIIDTETGLVQWSAANVQVGSYLVGIFVSDGNFGSVEQIYVLTVSPDGANHSPRITTTPATTVEVGEVFVYQVGAFDEDGDTPLFLFLDQAPAYAYADQPNGRILWTPIAAQLGNHEFVIRVTDGVGGSDTQHFSVTAWMCRENTAPRITSMPETTSALGAAYTYNVATFDADNDSLNFALLTRPPNMTIDPPTGEIVWAATGPNGAHAVEVCATDPLGASACQSFVVTVSTTGTNTAPRIVSEPVVKAPQSSYTYQVGVEDNDEVGLAFSLPVKPIGMDPIGPTSGLMTWDTSAVAVGTYPVTVRVTDAEDSWAEQSFAVTVSPLGANVAPHIFSTPITRIKQGAIYTYPVAATDDVLPLALTYALDGSEPVAMTINPTNGEITWDTTAVAMGSYPVTVDVTDGQAAWDSQTFQVEVHLNVPPVIVSNPVLDAVVDVAYEYDVDACDPDDSALSYSLVAGAGTPPTGMTIVPGTGLINWLPAVSQVGDHPVTVEVQDGSGNTVDHPFVVTVVDAADFDFFPPEVTLDVQPNLVALGQQVTITVVAIDDVQVATVTLTVDGTPLALDEDGRATFTPAAPGVYMARADVADLLGATGHAVADFAVHGAGDVTYPIAAITAPVANLIPDEDEFFPQPRFESHVIKESTDIEGTASDANLYRYTLAYRRQSESQWVTFHTGHAPVQNGVLGALDPAQMLNGLYEVRLLVEDTSGNATAISERYVIEGQAKVGNFTMSFVDVQVPMAGIPITVTRTYDSRIKTKGDFGIGWNLDISSFEVSEDTAMGESWEMVQCGPLGFACCIFPTDSHTATVTWPDGRIESYYLWLEYQKGCSGGGQIDMDVWATDFFPIGSATAGLQALGDSGDFFAPDEGRIVGGNGTYNPTGYRLTDLDGTSYTFSKGSNASRTAGLIAIKDTNGNSVQITDGGLIHSGGLSVTFERDAEDRIERIVDANDAAILFGYDTLGRLTSVTDRELNVTRFTYNLNNDLIELIDPRGITPARNYYNDSGQLIAHVDADGNRIDYCRDDPVECPLPVGCEKQEVIFDRLGHPTAYCYDNEGNVVQTIDRLGNVTLNTYDGNGNLLTTTDALLRTASNTYGGNNNVLTSTDVNGNLTEFTYYPSSGRLWTVTDPEGNVTTNEYDTSGNLRFITDSEGEVTEFTYDPAGNLLTTVDPLLRVTSYTYTSFGRLETETDPLGHVTTYTYDGNGNRRTETRTRTITLEDGTEEPQALVTTFEYDNNGTLTKTIDPQGFETNVVYNALGKREMVTDARLVPISFGYGLRGNLESIEYTDGTSETFTYDIEGRQVTQTNREGHTTQMVFDALGRLRKTILPDDTPDPADNPFTETEYDQIGRVKRQLDEHGNATEYEYCSYYLAGCDPPCAEQCLNPPPLPNLSTRQIVKQIVPQDVGGPIVYTTVSDYDRIGRIRQLTDARGKITQYESDKLGRRTKTIYHDGSVATTVYDAAGRKIAETDQAGRTTHFDYDLTGRIKMITDAEEGETTYTYDEVGNQLTTTDAEGKTIQMEYDKGGNLTKRTLAEGQEESFVFDENANLRFHIDFNGDTIEYLYDDDNRLREKILPPEQEPGPTSSVFYVYSPDGHRTRAGDEYFTYSPRGRMLTNTKPNDEVITYEYDDVGNRTLLITSQGSITYTYDTLSRLEKVIDPATGETSYGYDEVGNRKSVTYPNNTRATYDYDDLNRLEHMENVNVTTGGTISSYTYTLGPAGNRTAVTENTGRTVTYGYDNIYRLTSEIVAADPGGDDYTAFYYYDAVGNRMLTRTFGVAQNVETLYTYDDNHRLLSSVETETIALGPVNGSGIRFAQAGSGRPQASPNAGYALGGLLGLSLMALLTLITFLLPRRPGTGRRTRRRRALVRAVSAALLPMFLLSPPNLEAVQIEAQVFRAIATVAIAQQAPVTTSISYDYDDNGNTLSRTDDSSSDAYDYDFDNRLTGAVIQLGTEPGTLSYGYNADGIRNEKTVDGAITRYLTDANRAYAQVLVETENAGTGSEEIAHYVYGDDLISQMRGTVTSFYHYDGQMSVRQLTDAPLNPAPTAVTDTYTFDAFGTLLASTFPGGSPTTNSYLYTGQQFDANVGFYYLRARYYQQSLGRFLSRDPLDPSVFDPQTLHRYMYAANNPINKYDPTGLLSFSIGSVAAVMGAINILGSVMYGAYNAAFVKGGDFSPDAVVFGASYMLSANLVRLTSFLTLPSLGIAAGFVSVATLNRMAAEAFAQVRSVAPLSPTVGAIGGFELMAHAPSLQLARFGYAGLALNIGRNATGGSFTLYRAVVWNLPKLGAKDYTGLFVSAGVTVPWSRLGLSVGMFGGDGIRAFYQGVSVQLGGVTNWSGNANVTNYYRLPGTQTGFSHVRGKFLWAPTPWNMLLTAKALEMI